MSARVCGQCGAENDATRVFCANCGSRLPEATFEQGNAPAAHQVPRAGRSAPELPGVRKTAGRSQGKPSLSQAVPRAGLGRLFGQILSTALLAAGLAAIIQIARVPDGVPATQSANPAATSERMETLQAGASATQPSLWVVNEDAANEAIATIIQMKPDVSGSPVNARFVRAAVSFDAGFFELFIQQKFLGRDLYLKLRGVVRPSGNGCTVEWVGGAAGRLPLAPALLQVYARLFEQVFLGLDQATGLLSRAGDIRFEPGKATVQWLGRPAPSASHRPEGSHGVAIQPPRGAWTPSDRFLPASPFPLG